MASSHPVFPGTMSPQHGNRQSDDPDIHCLNILSANFFENVGSKVLVGKIIDEVIGVYEIVGNNMVVDIGNGELVSARGNLSGPVVQDIKKTAKIKVDRIFINLTMLL
jgi:hypothetical protein